MKKKLTIGIVALLLTLSGGFAWAGVQEDMERLGNFIYKDKNLSANRNQSCMTCHHPSAGFADPDSLRNPIEFPVSEGSVAGLFGGRNAPTSAYAGFSPVFGWDDTLGGYVGGMFWDGRATGERLGDPLAEQALGPFLNPVEMAMSMEKVVTAVATSKYVDLFKRVFPETDFTDTEGTYDNIGRAIAAFERSMTVTRFNSKFDEFWTECRNQGIDVSSIDMTTDLTTLPEGILTAGQLKGLALFNDPAKGNCAACHFTTNYVDTQGNVYPPLFTDFTYDNLGIPTNLTLYNLTGGVPPDLGLGGREDIMDPAEYGKFKVPTLRNVAKSAPYGHNGYFPTMEEIVNFYNTRDVADWELPEVPSNVNIEIGNLGLTRQEEWQIVAFMRTLTDQ